MTDGLPDMTAVWAALQRAAHLALDVAPHVFEDELALRLAGAPDVLRKLGLDVLDVPRADGWLFDPQAMESNRFWRGSIVGRARFIEDLVAAGVPEGVRQFVVLGAGLDTTALRRSDLADLRVFEVDEANTQSWKRRRIVDIGLEVPRNAIFTPVDFETDVWLDRLTESSFDAALPALVASTGVSHYITTESLVDMMRQAATLPAGSTFACTFMLSLSAVPPHEADVRIAAEQGAERSGTPWVSTYQPDELLGLARAAGFAEVRVVTGDDWYTAYFATRGDDLRPATSECMLVAAT